MPTLLDPTDILALVLLAVFSIRRSDMKATDPRAFPAVRPEDFARWYSAALTAKSVLTHACALKVLLNVVWFFGFRSHVQPRVLIAGGAFLFFAWTLAIAAGVWLGFRANRIAGKLGIVEGRRLVEVPRSP